MCWRLGIALMTMLHGSIACSHESDQYSNRMLPLRDSMEFLDDIVNRELRELTATWKGPRNDLLFMHRFYRRLGGFHWVDKLERMVINHPQIEKLPRDSKKGIYHGLPLRALRVLFFFKISPTIMLNGVRIGTDKLSHFVSQGLKYYRRLHRGWSPDRVMRFGALVERWYYGGFTTGVFSNADLVANYEGMRFYRSMFDDDIISGKPALIRWEGDVPHMQRAFSWADHVNPYWDEVINPSRFTTTLQKHMNRRLLELCVDYRRHPALFVSDEDSAYSHRYRHIGLRSSPNRMDRICAQHAQQ